MTYGGEDVNIKGTKAVKVIGIVIILNAIIGPRCLECISKFQNVLAISHVFSRASDYRGEIKACAIIDATSNAIITEFHHPRMPSSPNAIITEFHHQ